MCEWPVGTWSRIVGFNGGSHHGARHCKIVKERTKVSLGVVVISDADNYRELWWFCGSFRR